MGQSTRYLRMSGTGRLTVQQAAAVLNLIEAAEYGARFYHLSNGTDMLLADRASWKLRKALMVATRRDPGVVGPGANRKVIDV